MTNWDVNNREILNAGAQSLTSTFGSWQTMGSAPRDGTWVEIKNSYGVAPYFGLARWTTDGLAQGSEGLVPFQHEKPQWVTDDGGGYGSEDKLTWRPYDGDIKAYVDPTNGMQNSPAYWRGAVCAEHGLPVDAMEEQTAKNVKIDLTHACSQSNVPWSPVLKQSWYSRVVDWFDRHF